MKVYVLLDNEEYESGNAIAVFNGKSVARQWQKKMEAANKDGTRYFTIDEVEIDPDLSEYLKSVKKGVS